MKNPEAISIAVLENEEGKAYIKVSNSSDQMYVYLDKHTTARLISELAISLRDAAKPAPKGGN